MTKQSAPSGISVEYSTAETTEAAKRLTLRGKGTPSLFLLPPTHPFDPSCALIKRALALALTLTLALAWPTNAWNPGLESYLTYASIGFRFLTLVCSLFSDQVHARLGQSYLQHCPDPPGSMEKKGGTHTIHVLGAHRRKSTDCETTNSPFSTLITPMHI